MENPRSLRSTTSRCWDWDTRTLPSSPMRRRPIISGKSSAGAHGRALYANRLDVSFQDADAYSIEVATGNDHEPDAAPRSDAVHRLVRVSRWQNAALTSNVKGGYQNVALLHLPKQPLTWVTDTKWEATAGDFSPNGKSFTTQSTPMGGRISFWWMSQVERPNESPLMVASTALPLIQPRFRRPATGCSSRTRAR